jgi:hypothetical protein
LSSTFASLTRVALVLFVLASLAACGNSPPPPSSVIGSANGSADATKPPEAKDYVDFVAGSDAAGGGALACAPSSCEAQGKSCGIIADGCGGTLDCGSCPDGGSCGIVSANVCSRLADLCVPASAEEACAGKQCGVEGDGCGGTLDCGSCPDGQGCGLELPFQCAPALTATADNCPARIGGCAEVSAGCGLIGNGCGGLFDCGSCPSGQLCGVEAPQQCGRVPECQPLEPAQACAGKCGLVSNGCGTEVAGGIIDCQAAFPCPSGETCGGGGTPNQCGVGGAVCRALDRATACLGLACGAASDGCGGSFDCGSCSDGEACRAGACEVPMRCQPLAQATACAGKTCGLVGDGCGGTHSCGTCGAGLACGVTAPFACGSPGTSVCQPRSAASACAGKQCGTVFDGCGTSADHRFDCAAVHGSSGCPVGEACGVLAPFQCGAPAQTACSPDGSSCAALGWQCGKAVNRCGQVFDCAAEGRTCSAFETCRSDAGGPTRCVGGVSGCTLCDAVPSCAAEGSTRLSGRVVTPGRTDGDTANQVGVPNAFVYIPRSASVADLPAIETGLPDGGTSCDRCSEQDLGPVLASAVTDSEGNYTLSGSIPVGQSFLLVTKAGKFRRATSQQLPPSAACRSTTLSAALPSNPTRLPRTSSDGLGVHIPRVAVSTGRIDAMECVFEKLGLAHSEFGNFGSAARVHLYRGGPSAATAAGARIDADTPFDATLYDSRARLAAYDLVVADCEGDDWDGVNGFAQRIAAGANVREYVNRGGRLFASHLSFSWLHQNGNTAFSAAAPLATGLARAGSWDINYLDAANLNTNGTGVVSLGRPAASTRIQSFADWMRAEGVIGANNQFPITDPRSMLTALGPASEEFVFRSGGNARVQQFSFDTPYQAPAALSCGRVAYSGFHVAATGGGSAPFANSVFPAHCTGALTDQEKVLLYMLFDLGACIGVPPAPPACTPRTCPSDGSCGVFADGCGGTLECNCAGDQACVQNQCVTPSCVPTTCQAEGVICSSISDGCGHVLDCPCPLCVPLEKSRACATVACGTASDGCSGVYLCSECPIGCQPLRVCPAGKDCGLISDGCSGTLDCGTCASGKICGPHEANVCSLPECQPLSCAAQGATCGLVGDGCGGSADCGPCPPGQACTIVGGRANQCAGCQPQSCADVAAECGQIGDGCGGTRDCGPCPAGELCGAQKPNQCASGPACKPLDCARAAAECGLVGDGCGGTLDCGVCPAGLLCGVAQAFHCGPPPACVPASCESAGAECGLIGDGCGGLRDCGACRAGWSCGLGTPNVCSQLR